MSPRAVLDSLFYTAAHPTSLRPVEAFRAATSSLGIILFRPLNIAWPGALLTFSCGIALYRLRREPVLAAVTALPLFAAVAGFSFWRHGFDTYWFLVLAPGAALALGLAATAWRPVARVAAALFAAVIVIGQPSRAAEALSIHRLPEYGALVRGSRETRRRADVVRDVKVSFPLPPSTQPTFLYEVLGGRISPAATYEATIDRSGRVTFQAVTAGEGLNKGQD